MYACGVLSYLVAQYRNENMTDEVVVLEMKHLNVEEEEVMEV